MMLKTVVEDVDRNEAVLKCPDHIYQKKVYSEQPFSCFVIPTAMSKTPKWNLPQGSWSEKKQMEAWPHEPEKMDLNAHELNVKEPQLSLGATSWLPQKNFSYP